MRRMRIAGTCAVVAGAALLASSACGGGKLAVIGVGNSGNRFQDAGIAEDLAEALASQESTPAVSDRILTQIFASIVERAERGDTEAALIVLRVAQQQRGTEGG